MKRRELLSQAVAFAAWSSLQGATIDEQTALPWPGFGPSPAEIRKGDMYYGTRI